MKLAILGPKGTFSESAAIFYQSKNDKDFEHVFFPTINETFSAIGSNCDAGIIPIENTLDGYVQRSLDSLHDLDLEIIDEVAIPVQFSLVSNCVNKDDIKKIYVQFKAHGQCLKYINNLTGVEIITTESNVESLNLFLQDTNNSSAVIPSHMYFENDNCFSIENITDSNSNFTRFIVLKKRDNLLNIYENKNIKVALFIISNTDRPGILYEILATFNENNINLNSIMSRPTKINLGTYNFYIELTNSYSQKDVILNTLNKLDEIYELKILGIYSTDWFIGGFFC